MDAAPQSAVEKAQVWAIAAVVFVLPLLMVPGTTDYNYAKCVAGVVLISLLLGIWGVDAWRERAWAVRAPRLLAPILGIVLAAGVSAIQAVNGRVVIQSVILLVYFVLLLWMISSVVHRPQDVRCLLVALLASGTLATLYGILQYAGVVPGSPLGTGLEAIISSMGNRNHLGAFLAYMIYPSLILLLRAKAFWAKSLTMLAILFALVGVLMVRQTGTQAALVVSTGLLIVGWLIFRPCRPVKANRWWLLALAGCAIAVCAVTPLLVHSETSAPSSLGAGSEQHWLTKVWEENSGSTRSLLWWVGWEMLRDHPVSGVGLGNYKVLFYPARATFSATERGQTWISPVRRVSQAHNEIVQIGAELGALGLTMLLCTLATLAVSLWIRIRRSRNEFDRMDLLLLTAGIVSFLAHAVVSFPAHVVGSSLELVVFCGLALSPRFGTAMTSTWPLSGVKGKAIHATVTILAIAVSVVAITDLRANVLMERGISQIRAGAYAIGESNLQRSLKLDFAPRQTYYYLAIAQIKSGRLEEAEVNLEKCMSRFVDEGVYLAYAELEANRGETLKAQAAVDVLLQGRPSPAVEQQAHYIESLIAIQRHEYDRAVQILEALTQAGPSHEAGLVALGQLYAAAGLTNSARQSFEAALRLIDQALEDAGAPWAPGVPSSNSSKTSQQQDLELLRRQREYVIDQLENLL